MTCLQLSIVMAAYASKDFDVNNKSSPAYREQFDCLLAEGLISGGFKDYIITDKGRTWLEAALQTPMPVQKWTVER